MPTGSVILHFPLIYRLLKCILALLLATILAGCTGYLLQDHAQLADWFRRLGPCFYRHSYWERDFFTPDVKRHGNLICLAGMAACLATAYLVYFRRKPALVAPAVHFSGRDAAYTLLLIVAGTGMWLWAHRHILPYMDEVFSAVHCAEGHPFQAYAYYMLPNNHVLYNVINNILFHAASDHVLTGRILSGLSFLGLLLLLYGWCRQVMQQRLLAFITVLAIGAHFQVWGFAGMARGYELYLLCQWAAFICLWQYFRQGSRLWLQLFTMAVVTGFATLPTFLYFFAALVLMGLMVQVYRKRLDRSLLAYTLLSLLLVFLFYLPSLCFSGLHAYTANEYVTGKAVSRAAYLGTALDKLHESIVYGFTGYYTQSEDVYLLLAMAPLALLLPGRDRKRLFAGLFFVVQWLCVLIIYVLMRQTAFQRNLIAQLSITYAFILITAFWGLRAVVQALRLRRSLVLLYCLVPALFLYHYGRIGRDRLALSVYHFDINRYGELLAMDLRDLPPKASVAFSDESFYLLYLSRKRDFTTRKCGEGAETFYIKTDGELLPQPPAGQYRLMWERGDYRIYQRTP